MAFPDSKKADADVPGRPLLCKYEAHSFLKYLTKSSSLSNDELNLQFVAEWTWWNNSDESKSDWHVRRKYIPYC